MKRTLKILLLGSLLALCGCGHYCALCGKECSNPRVKIIVGSKTTTPTYVKVSDDVSVPAGQATTTPDEKWICSDCCDKILSAIVEKRRLDREIDHLAENEP